MGTMEMRTHDPKLKKRIVRRLLDGRISVAEAAEHYEISGTLLRRWARDSRFGGHPSALKRKKKRSKGNGLDPEAPEVGEFVHLTPGDRLRAYDASAGVVAPIVVEVVHRCPHCSGLVSLPE